MKKIVTLILMFVLLVSCGASRKATKTQECNLDSLATTKEVNKQAEKIVDTTRLEHGKVVITEIEFFPPPDNRQPEPVNESKTIPPTKSETANVELSNVGKVQGAVKSVKQTVIESDVEEKGKSEESSESHENEDAATISKTTEITDKQQEPTPDPYRWRYISFVALAGLALLLYLKRVPIINWIKKILAGILKIL